MVLKDSACVHAVPQSSHDAADDHLRDAEGGCLKRSAYTEDNAPQHDALPSTESLSKQEAKDGPKEASYLVQRHDRSL